MKISHAVMLSVFIVLVFLSTGTGISQDADEKKAVPENDAINQARADISSLFKEEYESATSRDDKLLFAKKMAALAANTRDDDIGRYALYDVAINIAAIVHDVQLGLVFIDELADQYEINDGNVRSSFFVKILKNEPSPSTAESIAGICQQYIEEAISSDNPDVKTSQSYAAIANDAIKLYVKPEELVDETDRISRLLETANAMARVKQGAGTAKDYHLVGLLFLNTPQKTKEALKYLAESDDDGLKRAAILELNSPETFDEFLALAASWLETSEPAAQARAAVWINVAQDQLRGFEGLTLKKKEQEWRDLHAKVTQIVGTQTAVAFLTRTGSLKEIALKRYGGTRESEEAVRDALDWIMRHQLPDGGWSFDHRIGPGTRSTSNPGKLANARNGATALALLPFLGYGIVPTKEMLTSKDEKTREWLNCVERGMHFLTNVQPQKGEVKIANGMADYTDSGGRMYSHGLCAITLCEAYGMTHRKDIMPFAQKSLNFIVYAQDPVGGGWRYRPREAGDTSVSGWQVLALKSGHMAYLKVPPNTVRGCNHFLDSVQANSGANYGYTTPGSGQATTAVGLLCRMYLGWKKDHEALERGVAGMGAKGPTNNMYYNYYATQVMHQVGGDEWNRWNSGMRPKLVNTQAKAGPDKGSWYIGGDHGASSGGRLYCTSMCAMILEEYYRNGSIYK